MSQSVDFPELPQDEYLTPEQVRERYDFLTNQLRELSQKSAGAVNEMTVERKQDADLLDFASTEFDRDFTARMAGREERLVKKIQKALDRIDEGEYGECEACGEEITYPRLIARPVASVCIDCKTEHEQREKVLRFA
jgi:DnaK suppressor protein